jgi:hypothetical protein
MSRSIKADFPSSFRCHDQLINPSRLLSDVKFNVQLRCPSHLLLKNTIFSCKECVRRQASYNYANRISSSSCTFHEIWHAFMSRSIKAYFPSSFLCHDQLRHPSRLLSDVKKKMPIPSSLLCCFV